MLKSLLSSLFFCLAILSCVAQQFNFQNYSVQEGLAQSQVYALLEDSRGYIWMGTRGGGLSCFDGNSFQNYTVQEGLANNYIGALLEDAEQNIWIGTDNGLSKYNGLGFQNHTLDSLQTLSTTSLLQDTNNQLWIGTNKGLYTFDGTNFKAFAQNKTLAKRPIYCIFQDSNQALWVGTDKGLFQIKGNIIQQFSTKNGLSNNQVYSVTEDVNGTIWVATFTGGLSQYKNGEIVSFERNTDLKNPAFRQIEPYIIDVYTNADGELWISTQNQGISIWNPTDSLFQYFSKEDGLPNNHIRSVLQDTWGNTWIATSGGGVSKYSGQQFVHYDRSNGLQGNQVYALCEDTLGQIWLSAATKGVSVLTDSTLAHFGRDSGFYDVKSKAIFQDNKGRVWLGAEGKGLAVWDTLGFTFFDENDGLRGVYVSDILQDSLDNIWVATSDAGITKMTAIQDTIPHRYTFKFYDFPRYRVKDIHLDKNNRLWYASERQGIGYLRNGKTHRIRRQDGLISNTIRSIVEDSSGYLWVGSADKGICKIPIYEDSLRIEVSDQALTFDNIYLLLLDNQQNLWAGSQDGLDKILFDAERNIKTIKHFGQSDGFIGKETCQNAALKDSQGNLWFGTMGGLTKYNPSNSTENKISPKVRITDIRLFYKSLSETDYKDWVTDWNNLKAGLVLPHRQNHLEFEFLGVNHPNPTKVQYQWRLIGNDSEDWSPRSNRQNVTYSNLAPNEYTFQLNAYNEDGVSNEQPIEVSFSIQPPFWQEWWFRAICIGAFILLIGGIIQSRVNRIRRKAKRAQEQLALENNLLQLKQKALQLQMNPHFIFNALNSIQNLIVQQDHHTARYQLAKFSKLMRAILENSRDNTISLDREIETLRNYIAIEKLSNGQDFKHTIEVEPHIDQEEIYIPPMMIQPFVENAILHGIAPLREKGKLKISFAQQKNSIQCIVEDNGIGFKQAQKAKAAALGGTHKSAALQVTRERLDMLHQIPQPTSSLDIQEIVLENGQIGGTKVIVLLPIVDEDK